MPSKYRAIFCEFSRTEAEQICAPWPGPRLVWPEPVTAKATLTVHDVLGHTVRNLVIALRKPLLPPKMAKACERSALWFALMDAEGVCEVVGPPDAEPAFRLEYADLVEELAGIACTDVRQFLLFTDDRQPVLTRDGPYVSEFVGGASPASGRLGHFIDLNVVGRHFATLAGRPLVNVQFEG